MGLKALDEESVLRGLKDADAVVREHAVKLVEKVGLNSNASNPTLKKLPQMVSDPSLNVRYQLAFTLGDDAR